MRVTKEKKEVKHKSHVFKVLMPFLKLAEEVKLETGSRGRPPEPGGREE